MREGGTGFLVTDYLGGDGSVELHRDYDKHGENEHRERRGKHQSTVSSAPTGEPRRCRQVRSGYLLHKPTFSLRPFQPAGKIPSFGSGKGGR